jgi:hypothetical protein
MKTQTDLCIYGGTSAGVVAAVAAARLGKRVVLLSFDRHLGGLSAGGLGATDIGNKAAIGGIAREFYRRVGKCYGRAENWTFEPHVAAKVFDDFIREADVPVRFEQRLKLVRKSKGRITEIVMEGGATYVAKAFVDATYEGDLMARAGVSYHVGREANSVYQETLNGVHFGHPNHNFKAWVDPYGRGGALLPGVQPFKPGFQGQGDRCVQAYNFRMCLTKVAGNKRPFPKPRGYDPMRYELLARYIQAGVWDVLGLTTRMPNGKTDTNNYGAFSSDNIGRNYRWPEGSYAERERIFQDHVTYQQGLMWFLCHDPRVPRAVRDEVNEWGLPKDEFVETGGWPHQLYVREARRMISDCVMTEHDCRGYRVVEDPVGLAAYQMDSHNCRRIVLDGRVINEGNVEVEPAAPYPISFRSIVPRRRECANLVVPVCLAASHIAYGSIRMEPVFMVLGHSAGVVAAMAVEEKLPVQRVEYRALQRQLRKEKQVLEWNKPALSSKPGEGKRESSSSSNGGEESRTRTTTRTRTS